MKCIILCRDKNSSWVEKYVPGESPYMLKIAGKSLLEFYIDFVSLSGIEELRIVQESPDPSLEKYFSSGEKWGMDISYSPGRENDSLEQVLKKNASFVGSSPLFIISGFIFIKYDKNMKNTPFISSENSSSLETDNGGIYKLSSKETLKQTENYKGKDLSLESMKNLKDFYDISMDILMNSSSCYVLPGYNNEKGVYIGQDVEISRNTKINPPVIISDKVRLKELSSIGPNTIIGNNVIVDKAAVIQNSIVYDSSYVGLDLELKNKFIHGNRLADVDSGEIIEVIDNFLISEMSHTAITKKPFLLLHFLGALFLFVTMFPGYIILRILQFITNDVNYLSKTYCAGIDTDKKIVVDIPKRYSGYNILNHIFFKLSFYKVPQLLGVLNGNFLLVGNAPKEISDTAKDELKELETYHPSVFSFSEMLRTPDTEDFETHINELFYNNNVSFLFNIKIVLNSLFTNLFK